MKPVQARISDDLHAATLERSKATGISVSHVIRRALEAWIDQYDPNDEGIRTMVVTGIKGRSFAEERKSGVVTPKK